MLVSFTQTYGSGRDELMDIHFRDKKLIDFKNRFDWNIYSFHNCEQSTIDKFQKLNKATIKNTIILENKEPLYTSTIRRLKHLLQKLECTHFFFSQDDTFSARESSDVDFAELLEYVKTYDKDFMLSLYNKNTILNPREPDIVKKTFEVYESTTLDFYNSDKTPWPFDDSPYICTIDMLDEIYDEEYLEQIDIWIAERILRFRYEKKEINRFVTNKRMFQNYNLYGRTLYMEALSRKILIANGLL